MIDFDENHLGHKIKISKKLRFWIDGTCKDCKSLITFNIEKKIYYDLDNMHELTYTCNEKIIKNLLE